MDAERAFAARLGGSCQSPIAAYAELEADRIMLRGLVAEPDGSRLFKRFTLGKRAATGGAGPRVGGAHPGLRRRHRCSSACGRLRCRRSMESASSSRGRNFRRCRCAGCWNRWARRRLRLPAVEIKPLQGPARAGGAAGQPRGFRRGRFHQRQLRCVSARHFSIKSAISRLAASGPATARALNQAGYRVAIQPRRVLRL